MIRSGYACNYKYSKGKLQEKQKTKRKDFGKIIMLSIRGSGERRKENEPPII